MGTAAIIDGNLAAAKESAISKALTKGVEFYLVKKLGAKGIVQHFQRVTHTIIPAAKEEIENFNILAEDQTENEYKVLVRIKINEKVIDTKLRATKLVESKLLNLKLLFLVWESKDGKITYWWKNPDTLAAMSPTDLALHNVFQKKGYRPISRVFNIPDSEYIYRLTSYDLKKGEILKIGKLFSADIVIYGSSKIQFQKNISLQLKAFDVERRVQIFQGEQGMAVEEGIESDDKLIETLKIIVDQLATRMSASVVQIKPTDPGRTQDLNITLENLSSPKQVTLFMNFVKNQVEGVKSVKQTRMAGSSVSMRIEFQGNKNSLLDQILNNNALPFFVDLVPSRGEEITLMIR